MKKSAIIAGLMLLLTALLAGTWWWRTGLVQARVTALLPALPDLTTAPPLLRDQLVAADAEARSRPRAESGFARLARAYHANGFLDEAVRCYAGLEQLQPGEPRWPHLHAIILAGYGEIGPALALWQKVRLQAPDYLAAHLRSGDAFLKANQPREATGAYEAALRLEPGQPYALLGLARLDLEAGRWEQARTRLEEVVSRTNYGLGYDLIVSLYERLGLAERAMEIRGKTKASGAYRDPADPWLDALVEECYEPYRLSLAAGLIARNGDPATARRLLERAVEVAPEDVSVLFQLGTLLVAQGDRNNALWPLHRCIELAPDFADGWANLSALQSALGDTAAAGRTLADGLHNCPQSAGLHLQYARNLERIGRLGEAIAEFQASIRLRPNEPEAYLDLSQLYLRQGRNAEGLAEMERALAAEPGNPTALGVLALNAVMGGDEQEARRRLAAARAQPRIPREQMQQILETYRRQFGHPP